MPSIRALIRVSREDQSLDAQRAQIVAAAARDGVSEVEIEWHPEPDTGSTSSVRPELERLLADCRAGRVRVVYLAAIDRLGRSAVEVLTRVDELHRHGVRVVSLRERVDFEDPIGRAVLTVMASFAEMERSLIRSRTKAGVAAARARGKTLGRPGLVFRPDELAELRARIAAGESLPKIHESGTFKVFDAKGQARVPSARAMRRALAAARKAPASPA